MKINYIEATLGIREDHLQEKPLLEEENCFPQNEFCEGSRLYADGSYYLYAPKEKGWALITTVKEAGLQKLEKIFAEYCDSKSEPPKSAPTGHSFTYRFRSGDCQRELTFNGVDFGDFPDMQNVRSIINSHLNPAKLPGQ